MSLPSTWQIDPAHSDIGFAVKHLMISTVRGRFTDVRGTVQMVEGDPTTAVVDVEIGVASVTTGVDQRDEHLRSPDFFDAANFPTITFRSRRVERDADGGLRLVGDLTIRGTTREVTLTVEEEGTGTDLQGDRRAGFTAKARISRSEFGVSFNAALETGGVLVGDEVRISLEVQLVQQAAKAAA